MKLTTKGRYAVTAMMDLALYGKSGRLVLTEIAERQDISLAYLEQLFASLRKAGLVTAVRGPKGGYSLAKHENDISLADILLAVGESIRFSCGSGTTCSELDPCLTHDLWNNISDEFYHFLADKKLGQVIKSRHVQLLTTAQHARSVGDIPIEKDTH